MLPTLWLASCRKALRQNSVKEKGGAGVGRAFRDEEEGMWMVGERCVVRSETELVNGGWGERVKWDGVKGRRKV